MKIEIQALNSVIINILKSQVILPTQLAYVIQY